MTQEVLKLSQEALAGLKDVEKQVRELIAENKALKEAMREHAMREVQRLGQEIEQEPVGYWKEHAQGLQRDYDSLLADFQAQQEQKLIGTVGELFDDKVIAHRKLDRDLLVYIKENT